jgi:hypothetical protein
MGSHPRPKGWQDLGVGDDSAFSLADFDRYVEEHGIPTTTSQRRSLSGSPST